MTPTTSAQLPFMNVMRAVAALALVLAAATLAHADTLMMPKRDGIVGQSMIVWGVTTLPNTVAGSTTTYRFNFGDGTAEVTGNVGATAPALERSYINVAHVFPKPGTFTVTMTITNQQQGTEAATVEVRIIDPADLTGPGTKVSPVGPNSNEFYRKLRINMAIQDGLRFLWQSQNRRALDFNLATTSWSGLSYHTALVVAAFENHGYRLSNDGSAPTGVYEKYLVQRGLNFVMNALTVQAIAVNNTSVLPNQPAPRDPCVGIPLNMSPCSGLTNPSNSAGYTVGISMMPLAASSALDRINGAFGPALIQNRPYREILQRLTNTLSWGQYDGNNSSRGGWGYGMQNGTQDGSVMGWVFLGLLDAEAVGIEVPDWVITEAAFSITAGWNTNGSWDYNPNGPTVQGSFTGMPKGGIPLQGMFMTGEIGGSRVNTTVGYISTRWNAAGPVAPDTQGGTCGTNQNFGCSYSMFNNFKGLQLQNVSSLAGVNRAAGPGAIGLNDWLANYEDWFVNNQQNPLLNNGGHWIMTFSPHGNDTNGNVAVAELILSGVALVLPDEDKFATVGLSPASASATEGGTHTVTAKAESTDGAPVPGATVNFTILSGPNAGLTGTGVTNANGETTFTYTDAGPIPSFGTDRIQATIGTLTSNIAEMIWIPFNRPPVANPNDYTHDEDTQLTGNVITDAPADTDPDAGDVLTAALVTNVTHGTLVLNTDGSFTYTPVANFCGSDGFTYDLNDGDVDGNVAEVTIHVTCVNDAPVAGDDSISTNEDTPVGGSVSGNDTDIENDTLTFSNASDPANGSVVLGPDGTYTYTPDLNFCGTDSFTYEVSDGALSDTGTVTIAVTCVNDAPVAVDDANTTPEDTAVNGSVAPDIDVENDALTYSNGSDPANGTVVLNADGSYSYTPDLNFCGTDSFTYEVSDDALSDTATVTIAVTCVNDAPDAGDDSNSTNEDTAVGGSVSGNDTDVDEDTLTYANASDPANGSVVLGPDGSYTYTPDANFCGTDTFTYEVSDGALTDTGTVTITVTCVNDEPVAVDDSNATPEDTPVNGTVAPDTDTDNATLTYENASDPANGSVTLQTDGSYTYTPDANFCGSDSFTYQVSDGTASDTGTVSIAVACVNDAPVAQNDTFTTNEETAFSGSVTANDTTTDVDGDTLVWTQTSTPTNGTLVFAPNGSFTYTPAPNFCGVDGFSYSLSDGTASSSATVSMTVTCVNDAPVARNDAYSGQWNTALTVPPPGVMTNDSDVDGDPLTAIKVTNPSHGTVVLNANGGFTYMPFGNFSGVDSFTYKVNDGAADSNVATVVITVTSPCFTFKKKHHHHHHGDGDDHDRGRNGHHRGDRCDHDRDHDGHDDDDDDYGHHNDDDDDDDHDGGFTICKPGTPKTNPDTYTTKKNTTLTVSASKGVRKNDGPQPTTVELISGPSHGTLTFNANGSFVYKPAPNFTGTDTFYYVARSTGGIASALERVKINVTKTSSHGGHDWDDDRDHDRDWDDDRDHDRDRDDDRDHDHDDDDHRGHDKDNKRYGKK